MADTGPGIPASERERVFDRFHRGAHAPDDAAQTRAAASGSSIVKRIADAPRRDRSRSDAGGRQGLAVRVRFARVRLVPAMYAGA